MLNQVGLTRAEKIDPSCAFKAVPIVPSGFGLQREDSTVDMKPFVACNYEICKPTTKTCYTDTLTDSTPEKHVKSGLESYASHVVDGESDLCSNYCFSYYNEGRTIPEVGLPTALRKKVCYHILLICL